MIEILSKNDINKVEDGKLKEYLIYSFNRLPQNFNYPEYGFFVVIETIDELLEGFKLSKYSITGLDSGLCDEINMVEVKDKIIEILVFVDNDINISLVLSIDILDEIHKEELFHYKV